MAESNRTLDVDGSLNTGSEVTFDIVCFSCNSDGQIQEAEGYCLDCCEHLCASCLKYHRRSTALKHHKIIDKADMPGKQSISSASDICTERCKNHKDKIIKYFCPTHKVMGCSVCITLTHKLCNDVTYIPEAAANLSGSQELNDFKSKLETLIKKSENITKAAQTNIKLSADYRAKTLQELEIFRQELNDGLDTLKQDIEQQSEEIEARETERMNSVTETSNQVLAELQRILLDTKELLDKKKHCKLFIDMKNAEDKLAKVQDRLPKENDVIVTAVRFQPNIELQKLIERKHAFGKLLIKNPTEINTTFLTDINVKSQENAKTCIVRSAALLSESKLVITNWENGTVKLIDIENKRIISEYKTETSPLDVAAVSNTKVAVTLPHAKKIQFLKSEDDMSLDAGITFNEQCWFVACVDDKLVVSFSNPFEVRILTMAGGEVLHTCVTSSQGDKLFSAAPRLSVSSFNQAIYASDWNKDRVTMIDMEGNVRAVYEDADLKNPNHAAVDDTGMVYLCGTNSNNIHLLTPDCMKVRILLSERDGIKLPRGICYCNVTHRLYVSMYENDNIKVFQL